ncbi:MAG: SDR family NAD(P)-dependent oxidoreductase [Candidatus Babeliales bacterium]
MKILITGGVGFIGCNAVQYFVSKGYDVFVIDNLSRQTAKINLKWLQENNIFFNFTKLDITDNLSLESYFKTHSFDAIIHLAGQVAVTTSVQDPRNDFNINALGTFNLLECVRKFNENAIFINASTNKVYGKIYDKNVIENETYYGYEDKNFIGVSEKQNLDFYSPYGCSKGIADQYTLDYARIYGLKTVSVRQSCIYGPHQFGIEDQGWIAWFIIAILTGKQITIYGNGKQVRDVLYVADLVRFYDCILNNIDKVKGSAFNMGGGKNNALSLLQFFDYLKQITLSDIKYNFGEWRPGDQFVFISDNSKALKLLNFVPEINYQDGIKKIWNWLNLYYGNKSNIFSKKNIKEKSLL